MCTNKLFAINVFVFFIILHLLITDFFCIFAVVIKSF